MKARFTAEAEEQADASDTWWREHREARDLFARELAATIALLIATPKLGTIYTILQDQPVRKVLMPRTHHHIYYVSDTSGRQVASPSRQPRELRVGAVDAQGL